MVNSVPRWVHWCSKGVKPDSYRIHTKQEQNNKPRLETVNSSFYPTKTVLLMTIYECKPIVSIYLIYHRKIKRV